MEYWLYLVFGVLLGIVIGIIPGIGGMFGLAITLPLAFTLGGAQALALAMGVFAATCAGGSITAILLGIPGTVSSTATVLDGFPLSTQGRSAEAIGAALTSSALGGVIGAIVFIALIPVLKPFILSFGPADSDIIRTIIGDLPLLS